MLFNKQTHCTRAIMQVDSSLKSNPLKTTVFRSKQTQSNQPMFAPDFELTCKPKNKQTNKNYRLAKSYPDKKTTATKETI